MHTARRRPGDALDDLARRVRDGQQQLRRLFIYFGGELRRRGIFSRILLGSTQLFTGLQSVLQPIRDGGSVSRILGHPKRFALEPAALARLRHKQRGFLHREDLRRLLKARGAHRPQRRIIVQHVEATAERGQHQVVLALLNGQVAHRDGGKVGAQTDPLLAAVHREEQTKLRPHKEQVRIHVILGESQRHAGRGQVAIDGRPRLA